MTAAANYPYRALPGPAPGAKNRKSIQARKGRILLKFRRVPIFLVYEGASNIIIAG